MALLQFFRVYYIAERSDEPRGRPYTRTGTPLLTIATVGSIAWLAADDFIQPFNDKIEFFW
jgi:hypothetical protein